MAGFKHGIGISETPTAVQAMAQVGADIPVVIGTAPLHLASDPVAANKPVLCNDLSEAVAQLGYSDDFANYTCCEAMYSYFKLYNMHNFYRLGKSTLLRCFFASLPNQKNFF
mgnify:CR=1 FL=1